MMIDASGAFITLLLGVTKQQEIDRGFIGLQ